MRNMKLLDLNPTDELAIGAADLRLLARRLRTGSTRAGELYRWISKHLEGGNLLACAERLGDGETVCLRLTAPQARVMATACSSSYADDAGDSSERLRKLGQRLNALARSLDDLRCEQAERGGATAELLGE